QRHVPCRLGSPASNLLSWFVDAPQDHGGLQARFIAAPCGQSRSGAFPHKVSGVGLQPASSGDNFKTKANSNSFQGRPSNNGKKASEYFHSHIKEKYF